jgi:hypothetical protein
MINTIWLRETDDINRMIILAKHTHQRADKIDFGDLDHINQMITLTLIKQLLMQGFSSFLHLQTPTQLFNYFAWPLKKDFNTLHSPLVSGLIQLRDWRGLI